MYSIALDGPAGAGKSTIAKAAAKRLGFIYIDTGALYRSIGYYAVKTGRNINSNDEIISCLPEISVDLKFIDGAQRVFVNDEDVSELIRSSDIAMAASRVSAVPEVRAFLLELQRGFAKKNNVLMDGRDIGTVVLPDADCKFFVTASPAERARRRLADLEKKGEKTTFEAVLHDIEQRDYNDSHREIAPLKPAEDSILFDTTGQTLEMSTDALISAIKSKIKL